MTAATQIPKVIHYCWFGGKPLPPLAERCISSWCKVLPDYEIRRWDESNFPVDAIPFTAEAASRGKWAFVSDYARFEILHRHGGVYFDTDVEVIAPIDDIVAKGPFMGWEKSHVGVGVNAGLGIGAPAGLPFYAEVIDAYRSMHFLDAEGRQLPGTVVGVVTRLLEAHGLKLTDTFQTVAGINIYPSSYFNPLDDATGQLDITPDTRSIHHYAKTWIDGYGPVRIRLTRMFHRLFGVDFSSRLRRLLRF